MLEIRQTTTFAKWFGALRDGEARKRISRRLALLAAGHVGDAKAVGDRVSELRIDHGPGYRLYYTRRGDALVLLLTGGDKHSQPRDIARAKAMAADQRIRDRTKGDAP